MPQSGIFEHKLRTLRQKEKENQPPADDSEGDNGKKNNHAFKIGTCFSFFFLLVEVTRPVKRKLSVPAKNKSADHSELKRLFNRTDQSSETTRSLIFAQRQNFLQTTKESVDIDQYCLVMGLSFTNALHISSLIH